MLTDFFSGPLLFQELGLSELMAGYELHEGLRQVLSIMTLLTYNLFAVCVLSHQEGNLQLCEDILEEQLKACILHLNYDGPMFFLLIPKKCIRAKIRNLPKFETSRWIKSERSF